MDNESSWLSSLTFNWVMTVISAWMCYAYVKDVLYTDNSIGNKLVMCAWIAMFAVWLGSAVYKTWFKKNRQ